MRAYLDEQNVQYEFIDFKKHTPTLDDLKRWEMAFNGMPVNTKGPTYRKIKEAFENASLKEKYQLLQENTSAIKRPILETSNQKVLCFGYSEIYSQ